MTRPFLEFVACVHQAHQGIVGFLVGKQGGKLLLYRQGFHTQVQPAQLGEPCKAVAFPMAGQDPLGLLQLLYRTDAHSQGCGTAALTFDRHPKALFPGNTPVLISTAAEREKLLQRYGMDRILCLAVTPETMALPWREFVDDLLAEGAAGFVCGDDFRFGHRGEGNAALLQEVCAELGIPCAVVPEQSLEGVRISSSHIRSLIEDGKMESATKFLGHPYLLTGTVVHGQQIGRRLGMPTANLVLPEGLALPKLGVYACVVQIGSARYPAVTNIGLRPTVGGQGLTVEPWILDFSGDLYGREITLEFYYFLRPEQKFPDLAALRQQIARDGEQTRRYLEEHL